MASVESGSIRVYESALRYFEDFLSSTSLSLGLISVPAARPSLALRALISHVGVVTAFISFCSIRGLSPATVSSYIDGLKFFSTDFDGVASIPNLEVVTRLLTGLANALSHASLESRVLYYAASSLRFRQFTA